MFMLFIRRLLWDSWNIHHIANHHVIPEEVEEVCHGEPFILRGQQKGRLVLIGPTAEKRLLAVILEAKGRGVYYPITAYPADNRDKALYNRLRGGDKHNTD